MTARVTSKNAMRVSTGNSQSVVNPRKRRSADAEVDAEAMADKQVKRSRKIEAADMWSKWSADTQGAGDYYRTGLKMKISEDDAAAEDVAQTVLAKKRKSGIDQASEAKDLAAIRKRIASDSSLTPFRKHVLDLLCQVPRGEFTTYKALSDAVPLTSKLHGGSRSTASKSGCARAVGMVMRTNPFAPLAPCHRVLTADGKIGGYKGTWGDEGRFVTEKKRLLKEEGVKFDTKGKVVGSPFTGFV